MKKSNRIAAVVTAAISGFAMSASAAPIEVDPLVFYAYWKNVTSGANRFDEEATSYSELTVGVYPSPDSDVIFEGTGLPQSSNGSTTVVNASQPAITGGAPIEMDHAGPLSGAYSWGTYVTYADAIGDVAPELIDDFVQPWEVTVTNPDGPTSTSTSITTNALNPAAIPMLATDTKISGSGLNPTVSWKNNGPNDAVTVNLFRVIDDDANVIRQVHRQQIDGTRDSFVIPSEFSGTPIIAEGETEFDPADQALTFGEQYVLLISAQEISPDGTVLEGVARTWFEFTAVEDNGLGDAAIYIPTVSIDPETGGKVFEFDIEVTAGEEILIDPEVAVGYTYETGVGDPNFSTVRLPSLSGADGFYDLVLFDGKGKPFDTLIDIMAGEVFDFRTQLSAFGVGAEGISKFRILGIEAEALLDPSDPQAFVTGLTFVSDGRFTGTQTPIAAPVAVSEPSTIALLALALLGMASVRSRRH